MKEATIALTRPDQLGENWFGSHDVEVTLVHELLHLHFRGFDGRIPRDSTEYENFEQSTELIAQCLVATKRGKVNP